MMIIIPIQYLRTVFCFTGKNVTADNRTVICDKNVIAAKLHRVQQLMG